MKKAEWEQLRTEFDDFKKSNKIKELVHFKDYDFGIESYRFVIKQKDLIFHVHVSIDFDRSYRTEYTKYEKNGSTSSITHYGYNMGDTSMAGKYKMLTTILRRPNPSMYLQKH